MGPTSRSTGAALLAVVVALAACGDANRPEEGTTPSTPSVPAAAAEPAPFAVDGVPGGFVLEAAGWGTYGQEWGSEDTGTDEPVTVLSPAGGAGRPADRVVVSTTGFAGYIDGLDGAVHRSSDDPIDERAVDGQPARFSTYREDGATYRELLVQRGPDVAVRIRAPGGERADLVRIARATRAPTDHRDPPEVGAVEGYELVGSLSVEVILALRMDAQPFSDFVPGTDRVRSLGWRSEEESVTVLGLSGDSADLDALPPPDRGDPSIERFEMGGRPAVFLDYGSENDSAHEASLVMTTDRGDVVVVTRWSRAPIRRVALVRLAGSVRRTTEAEWSTLSDSTDGGPGLGPDAGAIELARGRRGGIEWLLQAAPGGGHQGTMDLSDAVAVDGCLKLSTDERACPGDGAGGPDWVAHGIREADLPPGFGPVKVLSVAHPAATLRVTTGATVLTEPAIQVPGTDLSVAVFFAALPGGPTCDGRTFRLELLDEAGSVIGCVGSPP